MKKSLIIIISALFLVLGSVSCKKMFCKCEAVGYTSQSSLEAVLEYHIDDCVSIADNGPIDDHGVIVTCKY